MRLAPPRPTRARPTASSGSAPPAPVNGSSPPAPPPGAVLEDPPTATVVVVSPLLLVAPEVEDAPGLVVVVSPGLVVVVVPPGLVVVVGPGPQPVTQKTLCLTSAPWEPSAWMVSLTWTPWLAWGSMPVRSRV